MWRHIFFLCATNKILEHYLYELATRQCVRCKCKYLYSPQIAKQNIRTGPPNPADNSKRRNATVWSRFTICKGVCHCELKPEDHKLRTSLSSQFTLRYTKLEHLLKRLKHIQTRTTHHARPFFKGYNIQLQNCKQSLGVKEERLTICWLWYGS